MYVLETTIKQPTTYPKTSSFKILKFEDDKFKKPVLRAVLYTRNIQLSIWVQII